MPQSGSPSSNVSDTNQKDSKSSSSCHNQLCREGPGAVAGVIIASAFVLALFAGVLIWVYSKKVKKSDSKFASDIIKMLKEFTYRELKAATKCFNANRIIGHGEFICKPMPT
ncbi:hypothetical protein ACFX13_003312 [Malus domestica]